jgi:hypothetical protein
LPYRKTGKTLNTFSVTFARTPSAPLFLVFKIAGGSGN